MSSVKLYLAERLVLLHAYFFQVRIRAMELSLPKLQFPRQRGFSGREVVALGFIVKL